MDAERADLTARYEGQFVEVSSGEDENAADTDAQALPLPGDAIDNDTTIDDGTDKVPKKGKGKKKDTATKRKGTVGEGKFVSTTYNYNYIFIKKS